MEERAIYVDIDPNDIHDAEPELLFDSHYRAKQIMLDYGAEPLIKAGSPISASGKVSNNASAIGILKRDCYRHLTSVGDVIIGGYIKSDIAQSHSGIKISDAARAAMSRLAFIGADGVPDGHPQSDWNQNDNTQPDYVKNRPFYTGDPVETETIPATTVTFSKTGNMMTAYWPENFDFSVGQTYSISWDGTDYVCSCNLFQDKPVLGNLAIGGLGTDTGEPFIFAKQGKWMAISNEIVSDIATEHSICVKTFVSNIITIEEKYLPPRLRSPLIIDATNLPTDTSGWRGLNDQLNGAHNDGREILLDLLGNGSCVLPCVSWEGSTALFLKSSTDYSKINVYMLTAYVSDGGSLIERVIALTQVT